MDDSTLSISLMVKLVVTTMVAFVRHHTPLFSSHIDSSLSAYK